MLKMGTEKQVAAAGRQHKTLSQSMCFAAAARDYLRVDPQVLEVCRTTGMSYFHLWAQQEWFGVEGT